MILNLRSADSISALDALRSGNKVQQYLAFSDEAWPSLVIFFYAPKHTACDRRQVARFDQSNWKSLSAQLYFDVETATATKTNEYGRTYEQVIPILGANGRTINTKFVFMQDNSGTVRLVTGIPSDK